MIIKFMQYSPFLPVPLIVVGSVIERVVPYKLLGVYISEDLSWNAHFCSALRTLKKSGLAIMQLVQVYFSIVRSVLEYACSV